MGLFDKIFNGNDTPAATETKTPEKLIPEKEFGVQIVQLVEIALSDGILTSSERSMLRELALAKGVDIDRFEAYVDSQKEKRGATECEDGVIPLKKYNQSTAISSELKTMVDMALADGYLSDEERKIILNEASKLGGNIAAFEAGLNAIFMSGDIKQLINEKYPTSVVKRL
ncbi:MAG: TerB family tellurite resistance protein, partial [Duncaniella sp.]|nr:TerB family tellurite resistance protein [Duncaniella sp.]